MASSHGESNIEKIKDFLGIHAKEKTKMTPELKARIERIKANERAIRESKYGRTKKVEKNKKVRAGMYTKDPMSDRVQMVSGDMYQMPGELNRDAAPGKGKLLVDGTWEDFNYYNITSRSRALVGTAAEIVAQLHRIEHNAIAFNLETDMWDSAFDADYGTYELTVEVGVSSYVPPGEAKPIYLGGKTQVINEVVKNVGTTAGGMVGDGLAGKFSKGGSAQAELIKDAIDAAEGFAEQVAEHTSGKTKKGQAPVLDKATAIENLQLKVDIHAGSDHHLDTERFHVAHTWKRSDLRKGQISAEHQNCDRYFLWMGDIVDEVERMAKQLFRKMEVEGAII